MSKKIYNVWIISLFCTRLLSLKQGRLLLCQYFLRCARFLPLQGHVQFEIFFRSSDSKLVNSNYEFFIIYVKNLNYILMSAQIFHVKLLFLILGTNKKTRNSNQTSKRIQHIPSAFNSTRNSNQTSKKIFLLFSKVG